MAEINFTILGNPQALKRHRTYTKGKFGRALPFPVKVDPSRKDKDDFLILAHQHAPQTPITTAVRLKVEFFMPRPRNHYRTGKNAGELKLDAPIRHTKRPDMDNLLKLIADSLSGVFWSDDSLICEVEAKKVYDARPRTEIVITEGLD